MSSFWEGFEKRAGLMSWIPGTAAHKAIKDSAGFKLKRVVGYGLAAGGAGAYATHKLMEPPKYVGQEQQEAEQGQ